VSPSSGDMRAHTTITVRGRYFENTGLVTCRVGGRVSDNVTFVDVSARLPFDLLRCLMLSLLVCVLVVVVCLFSAVISFPAYSPFVRCHSFLIALLMFVVLVCILACVLVCRAKR